MYKKSLKNVQALVKQPSLGHFSYSTKLGEPRFLGEKENAWLECLVLPRRRPDKQTLRRVHFSRAEHSSGSEVLQDGFKQFISSRTEDARMNSLCVRKRARWFDQFDRF